MLRTHVSTQVGKLSNHLSFFHFGVGRLGPIVIDVNH